MSSFESNELQQDDNRETIIDFDNRNNLEETPEEEEDNESDYSLDYEYPGPRFANCRSNIKDDSASDLSDTEVDISTPRFDMWDDDPYNDFTWESNDMQLTKFIKQKKKQLKITLEEFSFWKKERGWPKQLPFSCSTTNHDQSANAICLVQSNSGLSEQLFAVYRDRIIECGKPPQQKQQRNRNHGIKRHNNRTTWIESSEPSQSNNQNATTEKFLDTHQSVSLSKIQSGLALKDEKDETDDYINKFKPFTKYIKRSEYPGLLSEDAYLSLDFDPQCLAQKYGYMAIGGVEGEFELYCCMNPDNPVKIWGTKFKGKDNVMLMTNAIQLVRWKNFNTDTYQHMLIGCMNEAGLLFYHLPPHNQCRDIRTQRQRQQRTDNAVKLHSHLRSFNGVPINDAKLSPDGAKLICVGDDNIVFLINVNHCITSGEITFSAPIELVIPSLVFQQKNMLSTPYSSQYVAWSPSSNYFAHTSDSHNLVLVWRLSTREILYSIDAAGYTYAIAFHPQLDNILVFTNRYGYFHTVDFSKATTSKSSEFINILTFDHTSRDHQCLDTCIEYSNQVVFHTRHLHIRHEITMVSFRGELNTRLRILAKINGIEWSKDGSRLYVATKKRVLAYQFFCKQARITSLMDITGVHVRKLLEIQEIFKSRKRKKLNKNDMISFSSTLKNWSTIVPDHIQYRVLGDTQQLACHW